MIIEKERERKHENPARGDKQEALEISRNVHFAARRRTIIGIK